MTKQAKEFTEANKRFKVISGYALEQDPRLPSKGVIYELEDGTFYKLYPEDLGHISEPLWKL